MPRFLDVPDDPHSNLYRDPLRILNVHGETAYEARMERGWGTSVQVLSGRGEAVATVRQAAAITFEAACLARTLDIGDGWMADGSVAVDGARALGPLPVPFEVSGAVKAPFVFENGCVAQIHAKGARLTLRGEAQFAEAFPAG